MYNLSSFFLSKVIFCSSFVCPQNRVFGGGVTVSGIEPCRAAEVLPTAFESASLSSIKSFNQWIESLIDRIDLSESEAAASLDFLLNEANEARISAFLVLLRAKGETFEELSRI